MRRFERGRGLNTALDYVLPSFRPTGAGVIPGPWEPRYTTTGTNFGTLLAPTT